MNINLNTKNNPAAIKRDQRIPPVAAAMFAVLIGSAILGAVLMDGKVSNGLLSAYELGLTFIGIYMLFAIKVASQWEKAVVLRLGKFQGLRGPACFGLCR